ncbi:MAG: flavin reductase family protein [Planctomycetaceae bacterium]|nr:flavin reductase family protein [Planctomycetaceae bacterium]
MEFDPATLATPVLYQHLIRTIMPRPIAWVSTVSNRGQTNLAPFSFFTGIGSKPASLLFCPVNKRDGSPKHTLRNILETREFVVGVVPFSLVESMNLTSAEVPPEESEFELAGLKTAPSVRIRPPRVEASPVSFECELMQHIPVGEGPGGGNIVVGRIVHFCIQDSVLNSDGYAEPNLLDLVGRLGGSSYCRVAPTFEVERPTVRRTPG